MKRWIDDIMNSDKRVAIPIMTHPGIEQIGRNVVDAVKSGEVHYQAIQAVVDKYDTAACTVIMDLTVEAEAFGCEIGFPEDEVPNVLNRLVCDQASVEALTVPDLTKGRVPEYLLANKLAVEGSGRPVLSGCIGPYSLAGRLYDMSEIMVAIYIEPDVINMLLAKCTEFITNYCKELKKIGVCGVVMAEPAAGLLSNEDCQSYSTEYVKQIVDAVQDENFTIILHNCGNTGQCTPAMVNSGAAALHFGNAVDMIKVLREVPKEILVMGNIDPVSILKESSADVVKRVTCDLLEASRDYPNFVLSSGCDMPPHTPEVNIRAFYKALDEYNASL